MALGDKYILERNADAAIVQKGTESEKKALRARLEWEIASWDKVYNHSDIEWVWYMLSRIDLSDKEERARVTTFIAEERKLKGGDAGVDFENPFKILEKNIGLADDLEKAKKIAEEKARKEAEDKQKEEARKASKSANTTAPSVTDEQRKKAQEFVREKMWAQEAYNKDALRKYRSRIDAVQAKLDLQDPKKQSLDMALKGFKSQPDTITAVAVQKAILDLGVTLRKWADGWFGPDTMEALEKLVGIVTPKAPSNVPPSKKDAPTPGKGKDKKPDSDVVPVVPQKPGKSIDPIPNPGKYMEPSEIAQLSHQARFERFSNRMAEFRKLMKQGDIFMLEKGEISRLQNTIGPLKVEMRFLAEALDFTKLTPEHNEYFRRYSTELAQYFSGKSETNDHFRDYTAAIFYAQKSLSEALVRNNITLPQPPTPAAAHQLIFAQNPKLAEKIKIMIGRKIEIGEILSNPKISREFNETWEKIYGKYEKDLQTQLSELKTKETKDGVMMNFKDTYERKAFETLIDTAGAKNRAEWISIGKNIAVIGAAIGATFATGGLALPGILAGAAAGGATMAAGTALSKGQYDTNVSWKNDHVIDFASGALPGAVGGVSAKIASGAITRAVVGTGWALSTGVKIGGIIGFEGIINVATATALEQARAQVEGYDLPLTDSLKNNLIWALLPIALSGRTAVHANTAQKYIDTHSTSMNGVAMADSARNIQTTLQQAREAMRAGNLSEAQKIIQANETRITQAADVVRQSTQTSTQQVGQNINPSPEILAARKGVRSNLQTQIKETIRNTKELRDRISTLSQDGKWVVGWANYAEVQNLNTQLQVQLDIIKQLRKAQEVFNTPRNIIQSPHIQDTSSTIGSGITPPVATSSRTPVAALDTPPPPAAAPAARGSISRFMWETLKWDVLVRFGKDTVDAGLKKAQEILKGTGSTIATPVKYVAGKAKDIAIGTKTESAPNPSPILNSRKGFGLTIGYAATEFYAYHDMGGDMDTYLERWGIGKNLSSSEKATAYAARWVDIVATLALINWLGMTRTLVYKTLGERTIGDGNWATSAVEAAEKSLGLDHARIYE